MSEGLARGKFGTKLVPADFSYPKNTLFSTPLIRPKPSTGQ